MVMQSNLDLVNQKLNAATHIKFQFDILNKMFSLELNLTKAFDECLCNKIL